MSIDPIIFSYGAISISLTLFIWVIYLELRLKNILKGSNGKSLEKLINRIKTDEEELSDSLVKLTKALKKIERANEKNFTKTGLVKFNAFTESGGEQSFALALLDREGNGVLLSNLYTRERTSVYSKEIVRFDSNVKLLPEERKAIETAKNKP